MTPFETMLSYFDGSLRDSLAKVSPEERQNITEIRLRKNRPLAVTLFGRSFFVSENGKLFPSPEQAVTVTEKALENTLFSLSGYSVQSKKDQLLHGFLPVEGGRAGVVGKAFSEKGEVISISEIDSINLRIGFCGTAPLPKEVEALLFSSPSLLVAGPPLSGKTTLLKSILSFLADRQFRRVAVADERGELYSSPGCATADYLRFYPKAKAADIAVRTLSPEYLLCDEIGSEEDGKALLTAGYAGVKVIASAHGSGEELFWKETTGKLLRQGLFDYLLALSGDSPGTVKGIYRVKEGKLCEW